MYKIKKKSQKKQPVLYNVIEDYTEFDPPGNVTMCAMTDPENPAAHASVLAESYDIPLEVMTRLLTEGGVYVYPQTGLVLTRGLFVCKPASGSMPKQTWTLDLMQFAEAERLARSYSIPLEDAAARVFYRTLSPDLQHHLTDEKWLGGITYIDFRKDWSPHFKRLCIFPDGRLVETSGLTELAELHGITVAQVKALVEEGGTLEVDGEVLACQIVNGQPAVARFNHRQYAKAKEIAASRGLHLLDALSEVGLSDPGMMRALKRLEAQLNL